MLCLKIHETLIFVGEITMINITMMYACTGLAIFCKSPPHKYSTVEAKSDIS